MALNENGNVSPPSTSGVPVRLVERFVSTNPPELGVESMDENVLDERILSGPMAESSPTELAGQFNSGLCLTEPGVAVTAMALIGDVGPDVPVIPTISESGAAPTDRDTLEVEPDEPSSLAYPYEIPGLLDTPGYPPIEHQGRR